MTEIQTFKIDEKFKNIDELYRHLIKNTNFIEEKTSIKIGEEGLRERPFCITGLEAITERKILFYATKETLPENIGELVVLAAAFEVNIIVFIVPKVSVTLLEPMNWLNKICNDDTKFILGETVYK